MSSDAAELHVLAMVAPTMCKDYYVTAVVSLGREAISVGLDRFSIGHDESRKAIEAVTRAMATVRSSAQ